MIGKITKRYTALTLGVLCVVAFVCGCTANDAASAPAVSHYVSYEVKTSHSNVLSTEQVVPSSTPQSTQAVKNAQSTTTKTETTQKKKAVPTASKSAKTADPTGTVSTASSINAKKTVKPVNMEKLVAQFEVKADKYFDDEKYSSNHYAYTKKELYMMAQVIDAEARNQPFKGKVAIGNIIMNRVLAPGYPGDSISSVITRKNQFCFIRSRKPNASSMEAATSVLKDEYWTVPQNAYFFRATSRKGDWGPHDVYTKIGGHTFYTDSYNGRYNGSAIPAKLYERVYKWPQYGCKIASRVKKIQKMLKKLGYKTGTDGYFGLDTKKALIEFQKSNKISADGVAGPATIKALIRKYGTNKFLAL